MSSLSWIYPIVAASFVAVSCKPAPSTTATSTKQEVSPAKRFSVSVGAEGYDPSAIDVVAGAPVTLVFKRVSAEGCGEEIVFADRNIRLELPLNKEVEVTLTPEANERIAFTCGMGMYKGSIVASS